MTVMRKLSDAASTTPLPFGTVAAVAAGRPPVVSSPPARAAGATPPWFGTHCSVQEPVRPSQRHDAMPASPLPRSSAAAPQAVRDGRPGASGHGRAN